MYIAVIDADSNGSPVTPYTCPTDKIAKVEILNVFTDAYTDESADNIFHHYLTASYKQISVANKEVLLPRQVGKLPALVPDEHIRIEGVTASSGSTATVGADVPCVHYLNAGESVQINGQGALANRGLAVRIRIMEENV